MPKDLRDSGWHRECRVRLYTSLQPRGIFNSSHYLDRTVSTPNTDNYGRVYQREHKVVSSTAGTDLATDRCPV